MANNVMEKNSLSFVEFVGVYKEPQSINDVKRHEERKGFTVRHEDKEDLAVFINKAFQEIAMLGGFLTHKREPHQVFDFNNEFFIPMHMFSRIECVVKPISGVAAADQDRIGEEPRESVN